MRKSENCTKLCPNRYRISNGCEFVINSCPNNTPLKGVGDNPKCYSCDDINGLRVSNCEDCPNREVKNGLFCILKTCPQEFPLRDSLHGSCHSCNEIAPLYVDNCEDCPNRKEDISFDRLYTCHLKKCPPEAPVRDQGGTCRRCDENVSFIVPYGNFDCDELCPGKRKNRFVSYGVSEWDSFQQQYCDLVNCPEGTKRNHEGSCVVSKN